MKWNLRSKLGATLLVALALLLMEAGVSQWAILRVRGDVERVAHQTPIFRYARDVSEATAAEASIVSTYVELHDPAVLTDRESALARQKLALARLDAALTRSPYIAPLTAGLEAQRIAIRRDFKNEILAASHKRSAFAGWMILRTQDKIAAMRTTSDNIGDAVTSDMLAASDEYQKATQQAALLTIATVVGSVLLFSIIAIAFGGSLSRRLGEVSNRLGALADELDIDDFGTGERLVDLRWTPIDESGGDEISRLARGSNKLVLRLIAAGNMLFEQQQRLKATLSSINDAVIRTHPDGLVDYVNPAAARLLGITPEEARLRRLHELFTLEIGNHVDADPIGRCLQQHENTIVHDDARLRLANGRTIDVSCSISPLYSRDQAIRGAVIAMRDVTEARALAQQLQHQATHDALTGLCNRRRLEVDLERALKTAHRDRRRHALLYLDFDQFKVVNDTCGHAAGDELLCRLATLFSGHVGPADTLARIGGDEFAILFIDRSIEDAERIAEELRESVAKTLFTWGRRSFPMSASIGLVPITHDSESVATALSAVDAACYAAKDRGRNRVHVYAERDTELARTFGEMNWVARINRAVAENRMVIYYQPIRAVSDIDADFRHVELLLRMVDEEGKLVAPLEFLPAAERYNLMTTIDRWVVSNALPICARLVEAGVLDLCAINLSGASLKSETLGRFLQTQIAASGIDPRALCFEITETVAVTNASRVATLMNELRLLGCRFALDDFGSGMSSFGLLKRLPVDYLKIEDRL